MARPRNLIDSSDRDHYGRNGKWKNDADGDYDDIRDYVNINPEDVFTRGGSRYVAMHSRRLADRLGVSAGNSFRNGGLVIRIGERKVR